MAACVWPEARTKAPTAPTGLCLVYRPLPRCTSVTYCEMLEKKSCLYIVASGELWGETDAFEEETNPSETSERGDVVSRGVVCMGVDGGYVMGVMRVLFSCLGWFKDQFASRHHLARLCF